MLIHIEMKKTFISVLFLIFISSFNSNATIRVITVQNYYFSPNPCTAYLGDTVKWQWVNGFHTTTAITYPSGAEFWDVPIDGNNQTFFYVMHLDGEYHYQCSRHYNMGMTGVINVPVGIKMIGSLVPNFELKQNYPNPFNPSTTIEFSIPEKSFVTLRVYDILGKQLTTLVNENLSQGIYKVPFSIDKLNNLQLPSGIYFYELSTPEFVDVKRMILLK